MDGGCGQDEEDQTEGIAWPCRWIMDMFEQVHAASQMTDLDIALSMAYINLGQRDEREGHVLKEVAVVLT